MRAGLGAGIVLLAVVATAAWPQEIKYTRTKDIAYGDLPRQKLDIYTPAAVSDATPVLVFFHGGGFTGGDKTQVINFGSVLAEAGVIVVSAGYRIDTTFPHFVEDAAKAVAYVRREMRTTAGDPRPILISGWSAGAYIGGKISYDGRYLEAEGVPANAIAGFIGLSGPYWGGLCAGSRCPHVFPPDTEADWPIAAFVDRDDPPMILAQGGRDRFVDIGNLESLAAAGHEVDVGVTTIVTKGQSHSATRVDMGVQGTEVHSAVDAFIARVSAQ